MDMNIRIEKTGDWANFDARVRMAAATADDTAQDAIERLAKDVKNYLVEGIESQWFRMRSLNPGYRRYKARYGYDARTLIKTGGYLKSITVLRDPGGWRVGIDPGAVALNGKKYEDIAVELEFGDSKNSGRPHWRPTMEWAKLQAKIRGIKVLEDVLRVRR